jgi:hypothetical protein
MAGTIFRIKTGLEGRARGEVLNLSEKITTPGDELFSRWVYGEI